MGDKSPDGDKGNPDVISRSEFEKVVRQRDDAKTIIRELQERMTKLEDAEKERETERKKKAGEHEKVIGEQATEITGLKETVAALKGNVDTADATVKDIVAKHMEAIPENLRSLVPEVPPIDQLKYITANRQVLFGDGKGGTGNLFGGPTPKDDDKNAKPKSPQETVAAIMQDSEKGGSLEDRSKAALEAAGKQMPKDLIPT